MTEKIVLLKLADHAKDDGSDVYPGQKSVAAECGCSVRTVQRVVKWACGEGILEELPGPGNKIRHYRFCLDSMRQRVRVTESQGDSQSGSGRQRVGLRVTHSRAINKNHQLTIKEQERGEDKSSPTPSEKKLQFQKPAVDDVAKYAISRGGSAAEAEKFWDFYESKGWKVGRDPMKDWQAAWRNWERRNGEFGGKPPASEREYIQGVPTL